MVLLQVRASNLGPRCKEVEQAEESASSGRSCLSGKLLRCWIPFYFTLLTCLVTALVDPFVWHMLFDFVCHMTRRMRHVDATKGTMHENARNPTSLGSSPLPSSRYAYITILIQLAQL